MSTDTPVGGCKVAVYKRRLHCFSVDQEIFVSLHTYNIILVTQSCFCIHIRTTFSAHSRTQCKVTALPLPLTVDSCYSDIVGKELIGQCQSEVRAAAASCIHCVSRCHCWFIFNLIVDGSIRVEWGEPVQLNCTSIWFFNHGQHAWWGGGYENNK